MGISDPKTKRRKHMMLEIIFSKEVLTVLSIVLAAIAAMSASAIFLERKDRKKYRRPSEVRQK